LTVALLTVGALHEIIISRRVDRELDEKTIGVRNELEGLKETLEALARRRIIGIDEFNTRMER